MRRCERPRRIALVNDAVRVNSTHGDHSRGGGCDGGLAWGGIVRVGGLEGKHPPLLTLRRGLITHLFALAA